jgi:hypothetical protein
MNPKDIIHRLDLDHQDKDAIQSLWSYWKRLNLLPEQEVKIYQVMSISDQDLDIFILITTIDEAEARKVFKDAVLETMNSYSDTVLYSIPESPIFDPETDNTWIKHGCGVYITEETLTL